MKMCCQIANCTFRIDNHPLAIVEHSMLGAKLGIEHKTEVDSRRSKKCKQTQNIAFGPEQSRKHLVRENVWPLEGISKTAKTSSCFIIETKYAQKASQGQSDCWKDEVSI